ncbi:torsin-1A-like [Hetaerina americana]|uniref:torsin-1A-like n=1 Tax=Hetaerina americana TaxID=62018 RepID=UPI003A7F23A1
MIYLRRMDYTVIVYHLLFHLLLLTLGFSPAFCFFSSIKNTFKWGVQSVGNAVCSGVNCCDFHLNDNVEENLTKLLKDKLFGQHIAASLLVEALSSHRTHKSQKALGIGLHGWTGTGKNYVSEMIAESLYKQGMRSPLVHVFAGRASFPDGDEVKKYRKDLLTWIRGNVSDCGHTLFIFDECDKWPVGLIDVIKPFLDYHSVIEGVDYRNAIFLFLTNTGGSAIGQRMLDLHEEGVIRDKLKFEDFHDEISLSLFNEEGGFFKSDIIRGDGIDFHIPFLPLEERHVRKCAERQFELKGYSNPTGRMIEDVLKNMLYGPTSNPIFSMTGCKRVHSLVLSVIARLKLEL